MDVKSRWNSTLLWLKRTYWLHEFTWELLQNPKYSDYRPLFTTHDEWTIVKYVMEVLRPFRYWTLWTSKRHTVTLHHVITVYNNMFDPMDGVMQALAKKKTQWKEDLIFTVKLARQKLMLKSLQRWVCFAFLHLFSIRSGSCNCLEIGTREWILTLRTSHPILPNINRSFCHMWRINTVPTINVCLSIHSNTYWAAISSSLHWLQDPVNHSLLNVICPAMMKNT